MSMQSSVNVLVLNPDMENVKDNYFTLCYNDMYCTATDPGGSQTGA